VLFQFFCGVCSLQLYKGDSSVWATGTDRGKDKPAILAVQARAILLCTRCQQIAHQHDQQALWLPRMRAQQEELLHAACVMQGLGAPL
jgi:hypothetical protein